MTFATDQEELGLLSDSVATLLERAGGRDRARQARCSDKIDRAVWSELAEAGILGVMAGEDTGGLGLGLAAGGVIAMEMGKTLAPDPFAAVTGLAISLFEQLAPDHEHLVDIIAGKLVPSFAFQERNSGGLSDKIETVYSKGVLNGAKAWVANAEGADFILVLAKGNEGQILCLVEPDARGMTTKTIRQSDGSNLSEIVFSSTPGETLATGPQVDDAVSIATDNAIALTACELLGVSGAAFELTLEFLKTREQFGKPIGSFQAIAHRAVDMHTSYQIADAGIRECLTLMDKTSDTLIRSRHASRAKVRACETALKITRDAIQMHGAVGYTDEFDIGLYLNRALALSAWLGDGAYHRRRWFKLAGIQEKTP